MAKAEASARGRLFTVRVSCVIAAFAFGCAGDTGGGGGVDGLGNEDHLLMCGCACDEYGMGAAPIREDVEYLRLRHCRRYDPEDPQSYSTQPLMDHAQDYAEAGVSLSECKCRCERFLVEDDCYCDPTEAVDPYQGWPATCPHVQCVPVGSGARTPDGPC